MQKAAEMLMETHTNLVAVIITTAFGSVCRMRMAVASRLHESGASPAQPKDRVPRSDQEEFVTLMVSPRPLRGPSPPVGLSW